MTLVKLKYKIATCSFISFLAFEKTHWTDDSLFLLFAASSDDDSQIGLIVKGTDELKFANKIRTELASDLCVS